MASRVVASARRVSPRLHNAREKPSFATAAARSSSAGKRLFVHLLGFDETSQLLERVGDLDERGGSTSGPLGQLESTAIRCLGSIDVELHRAVAGEHEEAPQAAAPGRLPVTTPRRLQQLDCLVVVVHEDLGVVGHALPRRLLDPLGRPHVLLPPLATRDLLIRHVTDQHMPERELLLVAHRRDAGRANELPAE